MAGRYLTQRIVAWAVLPVLVLGAAAVWMGRPHGLQLTSAAVAADMTQAEFEQRVRNYLLEHPEVVGEAIKRLQAKQDEQDAVDAKVALKAHTAEVFHDPGSPVGGHSGGSATLVEFFDYNCPYRKMMAALVTKAEATDPQLRVVYKEFPILGRARYLPPSRRSRPASKANTRPFTSPFIRCVGMSTRPRCSKSQEPSGSMSGA